MRSCSEFDAFAQLIRYGVVGVLATMVQLVTFYSLASTVVQCLTTDDWAVKTLGLQHTICADSDRGLRFAVCTVFAFVVSNFFCWVMNRKFVFTPGRYKWHVELGMFYAVSTVAAALALGLSWFCINFWGLMTSLAVFVEILVSFLVNYFVRKFFIFRG